MDLLVLLKLITIITSLTYRDVPHPPKKQLALTLTFFKRNRGQWTVNIFKLPELYLQIYLLHLF